MIKYEIVERTACFDGKNTRAIEECCTAIGGDDITQESFDTLEEALKNFKKYETSVYLYRHTTGSQWDVSEYVIDKCEYDEDGYPVGCADTLEHTEMNFNIVEREHYTVIATFKNLADAEDFIDEYDGEAMWELA